MPTKITMKAVELPRLLARHVSKLRDPVFDPFLSLIEPWTDFEQLDGGARRAEVESELVTHVCRNAVVAVLAKARRKACELDLGKCHTILLAPLLAV
jgi:hypothetical protein